ncbi:MAG: sulfite exporter TauE/SafE family protein [Treponema sp.]|jgi:uncharacterized membrane protein YfcA|nr:sulfite exporter TauE/SafE family protein [Treponema sp.]
MEITLHVGIIVFAVEFFAFFIKGLAAFGDPLISNPVLSLYLDNRVISPVNLIVQTPVNGWIFWKNRKSFFIKKSLPMLAAIFCGIIPGILLLKYAASWILKAFLGILILGIGLEMITRNRAKQARGNRLVMAFVSFCSGLTSGLYGINMFFVAYIERTTKDRAAFRGSVCFIFFIDNVVRLVLYIIMGIFTRYILTLSLIALPGMFAGFFLGSKVDAKLSEAAIRRIVIAMFMFGGLSIFVKALFLRT